jgi:hypothetical protein
MVWLLIQFALGDFDDTPIAIAEEKLKEIGDENPEQVNEEDNEDEEEEEAQIHADGI